MNKAVNGGLKMILIKGNIVRLQRLIHLFPKDSIESEILYRISDSNEIYEYQLVNQLIFEVNLRSKIINAARELNASGFKFRTFKNSHCNEEFWQRTDVGGYLLKKDSSPSEAIADIFLQGHKYGTECSTAITIIYYKALQDIYSKELFDYSFPDLHLMNWHYIDNDLDIITYKYLFDYIPGDCRYVENPDFHPERPELRGQNLIDLGEGLYYGHGTGIKTIDEVVDYLNRHRAESSSRSAFLKRSATRPNFLHLANLYIKYDL
jgi:protein-glutamine gamma-glutamyltransferase